MIDIAALRVLVEAGVSAGTIVDVVEISLKSSQAAIDKRRANDAERQRRRRHVTSRDVTVTHCDPPPAYTTPPKEEREAKKPLSARKCELPSDFEFSESDLAKAKAAGWDASKTSLECQRFTDHARANGRKQVNWHSAWANWVTSPYQQSSKPNGNGHAPRPGSREDRAERATLAYRRAFLETDDDCAGQDVNPPPDGVLPFAKPTRS